MPMFALDPRTVIDCDDARMVGYCLGVQQFIRIEIVRLKYLTVKLHSIVHCITTYFKSYLKSHLLFILFYALNLVVMITDKQPYKA